MRSVLTDSPRRGTPTARCRSPTSSTTFGPRSSATVALYRFDLGWYEGDERVSWGVETGHARLVDDQWRLALNHMTWLPPRAEIEPQKLTDYVGEYRGTDWQGREDRLVLTMEDDRLYFRRPGGGPVAMSVGQVEVIPGPAGIFVAEFVNGRIRFERDEAGDVTGFLYSFSVQMAPNRLDPLRYEKFR